MSLKPINHLGVLFTNYGTETYIYVLGIKPDREIIIDKNVTLLPVTPHINPDDMIDCFMKYGNRSEYQMGMLISTLRSVTAQLRIRSNDAEDLVFKTWNAQHICVQISAMLNCEIAWYFQANQSADCFNAHTDISMIHSHILGVPANIVELNEMQCEYIENNVSTALVLDEYEKYSNASNALFCYRFHPKSSIQLSIIWAGIESLFLFEYNIKNKLALSVSRFICGDDSMVDNIKELYTYRCKAVHEYENQDDEILKESVSLLHRLIKKCIEVQSLPNIDQLLE